MKAFRNIIFTSVCSVLLCGTVFCTVADRLGADFPDWMKVNPKSSLLEGRKYQTLPKVNKDSLMDGKFQKDFEKYVNDLVPMRDDILLGNAKMQERLINVAASAAGYSAHPTYYGSSKMYDKEYERIVHIPTETSKATTDKLKKAIGNIDTYMQEHQNYNYTFVTAMDWTLLPQNYASGFVSNPSSYLEMNSLIDAGISNKINRVDLSIEDMQSYDDKYFNTDHHWNMEGGYWAYRKIASQMGHTNTLVQKGDLLKFDYVEFLGSQSRNGRYDEVTPDYIFDYDFKLPEYVVTGDGKPNAKLVHTTQYSEGDASTRKFDDHYRLYFHESFEEMTIDNPSKKGKNLLIIGDSYKHNIERLLASHYDTTYVFDPREADMTVDEFIKKYNAEINDVLILCAVPTLLNEGFVKSFE